MNSGWSEIEVKETIREYFALLKAEQKGDSTNKLAIYRKLSQRFPSRNTKAFELKFQNISAILYELHLPYCKGLKPAANYQRLLKLFVLDHLDRSPVPAIEPHKILFSKLREIFEKGSIPVLGSSTGRYGLAIEKALGIAPNSDKGADFMGIELKTKHMGPLQTLFSRVPTRYVQEHTKTGMFQRYAYFDPEIKRRALYTSFNISPDSLGFSLQVDSLVIKVINKNDVVLEYDAEKLEEALLSKHTHTAFINVIPAKHTTGQGCIIDTVTYCKWPSIIRFLRLIEAGNVFLDFTMSEQKDGKILDHGFLWRIRYNALTELYLAADVLSFDKPKDVIQTTGQLVRKERP